MRSFTGFAGTPGAGSAFVGGAGVGQRAVEAQLEQQTAMARIAAERDAAAASNATRQQELQQEVLLKQQTLQQQALQREQELAIDKAYKDSILGLKQQELQGQINEFNLKSQESADKFIAQQQMRKTIEEALAEGKSVPEAFMNATARFGPQAGVPGSAYSDIIQGGTANREMGAATLNDVEGTDDYQWFQTGPNSRQLVKRKAEIPEGAVDIPGSEYQRIGEKVVPKREPAELRDLKKRRDRLAEWVDSKDAQPGKLAFVKKQDGKELRKGEEVLLKEYQDKQRQLLELEGKIATFAAAAPSGSSTNRVRRYNLQTRKFE